MLKRDGGPLREEEHRENAFWICKDKIGSAINRELLAGDKGHSLKREHSAWEDHGSVWFTHHCKSSSDCMTTTLLPSHDDLVAWLSVP